MAIAAARQSALPAADAVAASLVLRAVKAVIGLP
jgi:hypothetical protein